MQINLLEMVGHMGAAAMVVAAVLVLMGLASLTVFVERIITLGRSRSTSRTFARAVGPVLDGRDVKQAIELAEGQPRSHLARLVRSALTTYWHARQTADISGLTPVERTRRHLERQLEEVGGDLRSGMVVLSTVGSVAPFVGLLGTVLGILKSFQSIASTGSGGLSSVSAGIAEALVETALGLGVAIPAVLAFNYLSNVIGRDEAALTRASGELLDTLEDWDEGEIKAGRGAERIERVA